MSEKTKQKIIDWITVALVLVLAFTAGAAFMWQYTLHNYTVAAVPEEETPQVVETAYAAETSEEPLTVEEMILTEAEAAGIDEHLALAIARLETGHFTSDAYLTGNNVGGLSDNEVPRSYATLEDGVKAYIECLKTYYAAGLTTPELIGERWCPANEKWVDVVKDIMQEVTL